MFRHDRYLQFQAKPEKPDALFAAKLQEILGGQFGEMTVMMQYLWQGWTCRVPGKYKDMIMDIGTEEIGHVEMLTTMLARLLEGAPAETTEKAVAANPVLAAVIGGMNPQHAIVGGGGPLPRDSQGVPWNAGYIVASGNLLADFRSNVAAEAQSRLQTSRVMNMTDDPGVKEMLRFNLARDTYHQQQWLLGIEQLIADGYADHGIENSNFDEENKDHNHTFWSFGTDSQAGEGRWAQGPSLIGGPDLTYLPQPVPLTDDTALPPPPDPKLYATYDGSRGPGKTGDAAGAHAQGMSNVVKKVKDALD
ncbi:manganese catalase family protein [Micromonospora lupini]|uniref:Putative manganese containing catalase n=1 Tax=Micromonospora lupini str. Lupac 08 TaxID=1150864 RepID=I0L7M5_9ACTN|nr:manganese catalase family protein [Micromonospora lupini]CCH19822.1 Putative manganese containing catalase [Micromonospora lupini str. Lupac 08]